MSIAMNYAQTPPGKKQISSQSLVAGRSIKSQAARSRGIHSRELTRCTRAKLYLYIYGSPEHADIPMQLSSI